MFKMIQREARELSVTGAGMKSFYGMLRASGEVFERALDSNELQSRQWAIPEELASF